MSFKNKFKYPFKLLWDGFWFTLLVLTILSGIGLILLGVAALVAAILVSLLPFALAYVMVEVSVQLSEDYEDLIDFIEQEVG